MLAVGIVVVTLSYALLYVGVERVRGDKRSVVLMVMGKDAPANYGTILPPNSVQAN